MEKGPQAPSAYRPPLSPHPGSLASALYSSDKGPSSSSYYGPSSSSSPTSTLISPPDAQNLVVNCGRTNGNTVTTNRYPTGTCQPGSCNKLQCYRGACGGSFTDNTSWREHRETCLPVGSYGYRCVFPDCPERFMTPNLYDMIGHQSVHQMFTCCARGCAWAFPTQNGAIKHVVREHRTAKPPTDIIKQSWTARKHPDEFQRQSSVCFDISDVISDWQAEVSSPPEGIRPAPKLTTSTPPGNRHPESGASPEEAEDAQSLSSAVFVHITHQLTALGDLLDNRALAPNATEHRQVSQALEIMRQKLRSIFPGSPSAGWNDPLAFPGGGSCANGLHRPGTFQEEPATTATNAAQEARKGPKHQKNKSATAQVPTAISPVQEEGDGGDLSGTDLDSDEELDPPRQGADGEPLQHTNLSGKEQSKYFQQMQQCCVRAAYEFYLRHRAHLDNIRDKKSRQLCLTAKSNPISKPDDLSLPHWTHLLRRISDARGLQKNMVSRIESFNGDISPVDEVRHAFTKKKVKSDRDLLALVQLTRNFCWQLKDWDRCADLDTLYTLLEKTIREAKRRNLEGYSKPTRNGTFSNKREGSAMKSPQRGSATWPLMMETEGAE
ncbi:hypothetical protein C7212DRAFT_349237 [Tuber magnatum]|uniref:C2H2-type domain-containing protein n=1 Tax=Tuber magnatum TaxID=42249 RepID=A0A317SXT5_9PEZI|nr:hypothetical protein C7212DRAFT_349237 [Tuber magnatum]